ISVGHFRFGVFRWLRPRAIVRRDLAEFQGAEIGRLAAESIGDIGQYDPVVDGRGVRLEPEIKAFGLIKWDLSENSTRGPFHAAFRKTTNSVLVTAIR